MLSLEEIQKQLKDRRPGMVADATGLSYPTIQSIRDGKNLNPTFNVIKLLSDYLEGIKKDGEHC